MASSKEYKLLDLIDGVSKVDAMINLYQTSDDADFMVTQYEALKTKLVKQIIIELTQEINKSSKEALILQLLLNRFDHNSDVANEKNNPGQNYQPIEKSTDFLNHTAFKLS